jgi:hypothetical protein
LDRLIVSLIDLADDENYEIVVFIDADDPAWIDREPRAHSHTRYLRRPRPPTLGEKLNQLAAEARGDLLWFVANDMVVETRRWPERFREAARDLPKGLGVVYAADQSHPDHASYWMLTREMYEGVGFFAPPWFPYWFVDTWWDEIGTLSGHKVQAAVRVVAPDGAKRSGRPDLEFWVGFFEATRPMRVRDAVQLMQAIAGDAQPDLSDLDRRHRLVASRTVHMQSPQFVTRWGTEDGGDLSPGYADAKAIAEQLLKDLEAQKPRRVRVALCIPSGRTWEAQTATCVAAMAAYTAMAGIDTGVLNMQTSLISHSRNKTVESVLEENFDYLFWFDSDMEVPPDTILRLLKHQKDIVGATYNKRTPREDGTYQTLGQMKGPKRDLLGGGLQEAEILPGGVLLVKADVYRKMTRPWYGEAYAWPGADLWAGFKAMCKDYWAEEITDEALASIEGTLFERGIRSAAHQGAECQFIGEDVFFCRKCIRQGYQLWCDLDVTFKTRHFGTIGITCKPPEPVVVAEAAD